VVRDGLVLAERTVAVGENRLVVGEDILAAIVGSDEAVALVSVEPLDGSCCHDVFLTRTCARAARGRLVRRDVNQTGATWRPSGPTSNWLQQTPTTGLSLADTP